MNHLLLVASCICAISASPLQEVERVGHPRIVYGEKIGIKNAPYQVSVASTSLCGGTILSKNLVLTAGHCVDDEPKEYTIRSGSSTWAKGGKPHKVVKIVRHEDYEEDEEGRLNHDIAIMKVEPDFDLDGKTEKVTELAGKNDKVKAGDNAYVTGWGRTEDGKVSKVLKGLSLKIKDFEECSNDYKHFGDMTKHNICAGHPSGIEDMCNGDSGGPLVVKGKQVGIVSWSGPGCAIPGRPGVYTDITKYREWIDEHMDI